MDLIVGDALALDVLVNRAALFLIVAKGVEHLGECKVGQPHDDFFGGDAELPQLSDRPHRRPCLGDDRGHRGESRRYRQCTGVGWRSSCSWSLSRINAVSLLAEV